MVLKTQYTLSRAAMFNSYHLKVYWLFYNLEVHQSKWLKTVMIISESLIWLKLINDQNSFGPIIFLTNQSF